MMAGFYSENIPTLNDSTDYDLMFPDMMRRLIADERKRPNDKNDFNTKVTDLITGLKHELASHMRAEIASNPDDEAQVFGNRLDLTVAGYDKYDTLKVAEISLLPKYTTSGAVYVSVPRPHGPNNPLCELTAPVHSLVLSAFESPISNNEAPVLIKTVGDTFFCDAAGLADTAEAILDKPLLQTRNRAVQAYATAKTNGSDLSVSQMKDLAKELVLQTERREHAVGGDIQLAVLDNYEVSESPPDHQKSGSPNIGMYLAGSDAREGATCGEGGFSDVADPGTQVSIRSHDCNLIIDDMTVYHSEFSGGTIYYSGKGKLLFDAHNTVDGTTLSLGDVDYTRKDVRRLICNFAWKQILNMDICTEQNFVRRRKQKQM